MGLPWAEVELLHPLGALQAHEPGERLLQEGDHADTLLLVVAGRVKVTRSAPRGPSAVVGFRGPGALLGEVGSLIGRPRAATVTAVEPVTARWVSGQAFRRHLAGRPQLAVALVDQLAGWLHDADTRHRDLLTGDATARVAARLLELAEEWGADDAGGHRRLTLPITQDELAGYAGASLESTGRALRTLRAAGWLQTGRREITLTDAPALRLRAAA